jgi:hypothetical protein
MKIWKWVLPVVGMLFLASCVDITEDIEVRSNGSGQMLVNMDMSQLLDIMQSYVGKEEMAKQLPQNKLDTTIYMKDLVDTAKDISADKKALIRDGRLHLKLNMEEKVFKTDFHFPFSNLASLQKLYTAMNDGSLGTDKLFKSLTPKPAEGMANGNTNANPQMPDMGMFNSIYTFQCSDGLISRKLNVNKWKEFQSSPEFEQMKQVSAMGMEVPYTLTVHVPRPVTKVDNSMSVVSEDKKTVTLKYNITEVFDHPEKFEYSISY